MTKCIFKTCCLLGDRLPYQAGLRGRQEGGELTKRASPSRFVGRAYYSQVNSETGLQSQTEAAIAQILLVVEYRHFFRGGQIG